jgi:hypothetical protein
LQLVKEPLNKLTPRIANALKITKDISVRLITPGTTLINDSTTILSPGFF